MSQAKLKKEILPLFESDTLTWIDKKYWNASQGNTLAESKTPRLAEDQEAQVLISVGNELKKLLDIKQDAPEQTTTEASGVDQSQQTPSSKTTPASPEPARQQEHEAQGNTIEESPAPGSEVGPSGAASVMLTFVQDAEETALEGDNEDDEVGEVPDDEDEELKQQEEKLKKYIAEFEKNDPGTDLANNLDFLEELPVDMANLFMDKILGASDARAAAKRKTEEKKGLLSAFELECKDDESSPGRTTRGGTKPKRQKKVSKKKQKEIDDIRSQVEEAEQEEASIESGMRQNFQEALGYVIFF